MKYYAAAGIALVALLIGACGGSGLKKSDISDIAGNFYRALSDDPPKAYNYLSQDCRSKIGYLDFVSTINAYHGFAGQGKLELRNVKIVDETSSHVTADYDVVLVSDGDEIPLTGQLDLPGPTKFVKEHGRWRFEDCAGFPASGNDALSTPETTKTPAAGATPTFEPGSSPAIEGDNDPSLPGKFVDLQKIYGGFWGNQNGTNTARHMQQIIDYSVQGLPPAGGPHWGSARCPDDPDAAPLYCGPVPWGVYRKPWPAESVVHNMEHAGVIIWYNTSDQGVISQIEALARKNIAGGKLIVVTPYTAMEQGYVALTAWGRRDKFPISDYSDARAQDFIDKLECRFDPERLCGNQAAPTPTPLSGSAA